MWIFYHKISKLSIIWSTYSYNRSLVTSLPPYELWRPLITFLAMRGNKICCFLAKEKNQPFYWLIFVSTCSISSNKNVICTDGGSSPSGRVVKIVHRTIFVLSFVSALTDTKLRPSFSSPTNLQNKKHSFAMLFLVPMVGLEPTWFPARFWVWCVCQFRHIGIYMLIHISIYSFILQ